MDKIVIGGQSIDLVLTRKPIRHLYVRLKNDGKLWISAPNKMQDAEILRFLETKAPLLAKRLNVRTVKDPFLNDHAWWFGRQVPIRVTPGRIPFADGDAVWLPFDKDPSAALEILYRQAVVEKAKRLWIRWEPRLPKSILRDWTFVSSPTRSVYGSCSKKTKTIRLSSLLGRLDEAHLETIFVHELAHLLASGHGSDFYKVLLGWMPDYKQRHRALVAAHRKIEG